MGNCCSKEEKNPELNIGLSDPNPDQITVDSGSTNINAQKADPIKETPTVVPEQPKNPPTPDPPTPNPPPQDTNIQNSYIHGLNNMDNEDAFGLLLCGTGESGKTTFTRQLRIRFLSGFTNDELSTFVNTIRGNLVETIQQLGIWMNHQQIDIDDEISGDFDEISSIDAFNCEYSYDLCQTLKTLWNHPSFQEAFAHKDETIIPDNMDYFFSRIDEIYDDDYQPSTEDVLRARIRTIGISDVTFNMQGALIRMYDVGGQKSERNKWARVMNEVAGLIYCISFADFDKYMFEQPDVLRINDSLSLFGDVIKKEKFSQSPIFIIANKYDLFSDKIRNTNKFSQVFPDYKGNPHDPESCCEYLLNRFRQQVSSSQRVATYTINALNPDQVADTANDICQFISRNYFE